MGQHFVLSDFENVQFKDIGSLKPGECRIKLFVGQSQTRMPVELFEALRPFGTDADVVRISGSGPNALDFHIAFYVGRPAAEFPDARFSIISRDTGFDPLIKHLASQNIACERLGKVPAAPKPSVPSAHAAAKKKANASRKSAAKNVVVTVLPASQAKSAATAAEANTESRAAEALKRLKDMSSSRPTRAMMLRSSIKSFFKPALNDKQVASVIQSLADRKKIVIEGTKVSYAL